MKRFLIHLVILGVIGAVIGGSMIAFGLYNVSARQGHLPPVEWALHTTFRNSVKLRAPSEDEVPDLARPDLVQLGAGHYDSACSFCHGIPGEGQNETTASMVPRPPLIAEAVKDWEPQHLYWIVHNGAKMTGMPHWPSEVRSDDVWPVVAFLESARDIESDEYHALLAAGTAPREAGDVAQLGYCATCHGYDGLARGNTVIPRLDILSPVYIRESLGAYRSGMRQSGMMRHAASLPSPDELAALADYYGSLGVQQELDEETGTEPDRVEAGRALAQGGARIDQSPACAACHGPWPEPIDDAFPSLSGQREEYLLTQLHLWKEKTRGGTERAAIMHKVIPALEEPEMEALAAYYASLPAAKH